VSYTGLYNYAYSAYNYSTAPNGMASAKIQWVSPFVSLDLNARYAFEQQDGFLKNASIQVNVYNVLDQNPPFQQITGASGGFASEAANPLGRTFRFTLEKKF